jgi:hypothetical protein
LGYFLGYFWNVDMKNLKQVQTIHGALTKEKNRLCSELINLNLHINKKVDSLKKILEYHHEYAEGNHLNFSRSIPALNKNLDFFANRMLVIVNLEEKEIAILEKHKSAKLNEIEVVENKIKLMNHFSGMIIAETNMKQETMEQLTLDDLSSMKSTRGDYE